MILGLGFAVIVLGLLGSAQAQQMQSAGNGGSGVTIGGKSSAPSAGQTCVQVQVAGQKPSPYDCLNQQLQQQVQGTSPSQASPPLTATSPSNQVGTFNLQGLSEQYGQNLGKSATPYRPPTPAYSNPLHSP